MTNETSFQDVQNKFNSFMENIDKHKLSISEEIKNLKIERDNLDKTISDCEKLLGYKL